MLKQPHRKIKVVRIIARLNVGGPAKQALFLTHNLNPELFQCYLITGVVGDGEENLLSPNSSPGERVFVLPMLGRDISWWQDVCSFLEICRILKVIRPDIVHTHTAKAGAIGRLAAMWARVPIKIHTYHGHVFREYFGRLKTSLFILIEQALASITDRIVVLSESQLRDLACEFKIAPRQKFQIIRLGFNLLRFVSVRSESAARAAYGIVSDAFVLGFIGRLVPIKNPLLLLESFSRANEHFHRSIPDSLGVHRYPWHLLIVGGGPLQKSMQTDVQAKQLTKQVMFLGWQHQVEQIYSALDVVVLTSLNEGTPVTLIEAMASGKPFIGTDVGGVRDLMVGDGKLMQAFNGGRFTKYKNGIVVQAQDLQGLVGALLYLSANPEEGRAMGQVGRETALELFEENRLLGEISALYENLFHEKVHSYSCVLG